MSYMPKHAKGPGGRPPVARLPDQASYVFREEIDVALMARGKPVAFLAGTASGIERSARTLRQDMVHRGNLKVEAARFLARRAFTERIINRNTYLKLKAIIALCDPMGHTVLRGRFFLGASLEGEVAAAIKKAAPKIPAKTRDAIDVAIKHVLRAAGSRASKAGVESAYAQYLERLAPSILREARNGEAHAQFRAFKEARRVLGKEASAKLVAAEVDSSYSLLDEN